MSKITFGKYRGKTAEFVIITDICYTQYVRNFPNPEEPLRSLQREVNQLIERLDDTPFIYSCATKGCNNPTYHILDLDNIFFKQYMCDECVAKLDEPTIESYDDFCRHLQKSGYYKDEIKFNKIREFAISKGLPDCQRVSQQIAYKFFHS